MAGPRVIPRPPFAEGPGKGTSAQGPPCHAASSLRRMIPLDFPFRLLVRSLAVSRIWGAPPLRRPPAAVRSRVSGGPAYPPAPWECGPSPAGPAPRPVFTFQPLDDWPRAGAAGTNRHAAALPDSSQEARPPLRSAESGGGYSSVFSTSAIRSGGKFGNGSSCASRQRLTVAIAFWRFVSSRP